MPDGDKGDVWAWFSSIARLGEILPIESKQSKESQSVKTTLGEKNKKNTFATQGVLGMFEIKFCTCEVQGV
jgi:hypothetical protein